MDEGNYKGLYNQYKFAGAFKIDEQSIEPWFDFSSSKPWDEGEIPWIFDNKVKREILILLSHTPLELSDIAKRIKFSPKPLTITKDEHDCKVKYAWPEKTIKNHVLNLENLDVIRKDEHGMYHLQFPILHFKDLKEIEPYITKVSVHWVKIIKELKDEMINLSFGQQSIDKKKIVPILIEKSLEKLYTLLKLEGIIPENNEIKIQWAEQLRESKFDKWVEDTFN